MPRFLALFALTMAPLLAQAEEVISVYNWNDYIAPQVLVDFEKETGIHVDYHTFSTTEELASALDAGTPIDIAVPTHNLLPRLIKAGQLQPLNFDLLPNRQHLDKSILSKLAAFDSQNRYAAPYLWGAVGLAVNTTLAEAALGHGLPNSWSLLFDPVQAGKLAHCGISLLDASDESLSALMTYQGRNLDRSSPRQLLRAGELLTQLHPNLRYIDSQRYIDDLSTGKLCLAMAFVGDALVAADKGQPVRFLVPDEGSPLFIDSLVIPSNAKRADLAHRFIDYLMQPRVAALITSEVLYPNANKDSAPFMDENLRQQLRLLDDSKRRMYAQVPLPDKLEVIKNQIWERLKATPASASLPTP